MVYVAIYELKESIKNYACGWGVDVDSLRIFQTVKAVLHEIFNHLEVWACSVSTGVYSEHRLRNTKVIKDRKQNNSK